MGLVASGPIIVNDGCNDEPHPVNCYIDRYIFYINMAYTLWKYYTQQNTRLLRRLRALPLKICTPAELGESHIK